MVVDVCKVNLGFVRHEALDFLLRFLAGGGEESSASINVVASQTINKSFDRLQCSLMKGQVSREDVH